MKSLSSVGLGLSVVFGFLMLALIAELYYLLWWKKRFTKTEIESDYINPATEILYLFCWRRRRSPSSSSLNPQELCSSSSSSSSSVMDTLVQGPQSISNKDFMFKPFGSGGGGGDDDSVEAELMSLHNLSGPPRFLFTIIEETMEDLESEDGKSKGDIKSRKGSRSLSDLLVNFETPFLTPLASPPFVTPPLTPINSSNSQQRNEFNPFFESSSDVEFSKIRSSSSPPPPPPSKFKFLQDAEEKLYRRRLVVEEEEQKQDHKNSSGFVQEDGILFKASNSNIRKDEDEDGSFITIIVDKNIDHQQQ